MAANESTPPSPAAADHAPYAKVEDVINDPIACSYLRKFASSQHCCENLDFWILVDRFKCGFKEDDQELMKERANQIWDQHISVTAPAEISMDSGTRTHMNEIISKPITSSSFDPALKLSLVTLKKDIYPRFIKSPMYTALKEMLAKEYPDQGFRAPDKTLFDVLSPEELKKRKEEGDFTMDDVLNDKNLMEVFHSSLAKKFCTENLLFYCEVQRFEKMLAAKDEAACESQVWYIYKNFLEPNSVHQISSSTSARKEIGLVMAIPTTGMYNEVLKGVLLLLKNEFDSFKKTEEYAKLTTLSHENSGDSAQSGACSVM